ncbi:MAG: hypothetical protein U1E36_05920 [Rickettsiales bacterium]
MKLKLVALVAYGIYEYNKRLIQDGQPSLFAQVDKYLRNKINRNAHKNTYSSSGSDADESINDVNPGRAI